MNFILAIMYKEKRAWSRMAKMHILNFEGKAILSCTLIYTQIYSNPQTEIFGMEWKITEIKDKQINGLGQIGIPWVD